MNDAVRVAAGQMDQLFARDLTQRREIVVTFVRTEDWLADKQVT